MICISNNSILVVYKSRELVEEIVRLINDESITLITAASSIEALSKMSFQLPNLIISEYELTDDNGIDFCSKIRSSIKTKLIPFIIVSDVENNQERIRALEEGADAFFVRPYDAGELTAHINNKLSYYNDFYQLLIRDELTNLYNRREFITQFNRLTGNEEKIIISVAMIDIDFFKQVNDIHGHQVGDLVLMKFAEMLNEHTNENFIPTRFGGEEFAVLMPYIDTDKAYTLIESIRIKFYEHEFRGSKKKIFHVSFSCGIATYPEFADNISDILSLADQALYSAKKEGRRRTYIYKKHMSYNDRFWEYFDKKTNFFLDGANNDAVTGLPYLAKVLEFISNQSEDINSVGVLIINIYPLQGVRPFFGPHIQDIMIQNIYSSIKQVCYSEYASETYYSISSYIDYSFTILFPSLFDFTLNKDKCRELFAEMADLINRALAIYPYNISFSNGVVYYDKIDRKQLLNEISFISENISDFPVKYSPYDNSDLYSTLVENYTTTPVYNSRTGEAELSMPTRKKTDSYIADIDFFLTQCCSSKEQLQQIINFYIDTSETKKILVPFIESFSIEDFISAISEHLENNTFCILFNENFIYKNKILISQFSFKNKRITFGINNCYISPELLKILSIADFELIVFSKYLFYNLHEYRNRIKLISGLIDFAYQLKIKICVSEIVKSKDIHFIHALRVDYYSKL